VDRANFFRTQLLFWAMAATDCHAKNFSLRLLAGGRYQLSPLYDILSTYPVQGRKAHPFDPRNSRLAMAVESRNRHYVLHDIHRWHWVAMAASLGRAEGIEQIIAELIERTPSAFDTVAEYLPEGFPIALFDSVKAGTTAAVKRLTREPDRRSTP
jgi:serine/threonine-protein kinase HipA